MGRRRRKDSNRDEERQAAPRPLTDAVTRKIEEWAAEAADAQDLVLYHVEIKNPWVIQIFVDAPNSAPGEGVNVDQCARVSRYVEGFLDIDEKVWPHYTLEVSSPGIERKLKTPRHYELSIGKDVRIVVHDPIDKENVFEGTLIAFENEIASLERGADDVVTVEWDNIAKSRLIHDFSE